MRRILVNTLFSLLVLKIHTISATISAPTATKAQNHQVANMLSPLAAPFWLKNFINAPCAKKKVMMVSASTVRVSLRRSPTIEPTTLENEVRSREAM